MNFLLVENELIFFVFVIILFFDIKWFGLNLNGLGNKFGFIFIEFKLMKRVVFFGIMYLFIVMLFFSVCGFVVGVMLVICKIL